MPEDFASFTAHILYFIQPDDEVVVTEGVSHVRPGFCEYFPSLCTLLQRARILQVKINSDVYLLYSWTDRDGQPCGWLCKQEPVDVSFLPVLREHQLLVDSLGGISEIYNGPDGAYTANQHFLFLKSSCTWFGAGWLDYYLNVCEEENSIPIATDGLIRFTEEVNGTCMCYDIHSRQVMLFSHDHAFSNVTELPGQPACTFYRITGIDSFTDYVEALAAQWLDHLLPYKVSHA